MDKGTGHQSPAWGDIPLGHHDLDEEEAEAEEDQQEEEKEEMTSKEEINHLDSRHLSPASSITEWLNNQAQCSTVIEHTTCDVTKISTITNRDNTTGVAGNSPGGWFRDGNEEECDGDDVASPTALRRGERLAPQSLVTPGAEFVYTNASNSRLPEDVARLHEDDTVQGDTARRSSVNQGSRIPEATMVPETSLVHAVREDPSLVTATSKRWSRRNVGTLMLFLLGVAIVVVVVVRVVNGNLDGGGNPLFFTSSPSISPSSSPSVSIEPTLSPSHSLRQHVVELIQSHSPKTNFSSNTTSSALDWIVNDVYSIPLEAGRLLQRFALATVWFALGLNPSTGCGLDDWMKPIDECDWRGDSYALSPVCDSGGVVVKLELLDSNSTGSIPTELFLLSHLSHLVLENSMSLTGTIPSQLALLTALTALRFGPGYLTGTIPYQLWSSVTNLEWLVISNNPEMSPFSISSEVASLSKLKSLVLHDVPLSGSIPTQVGSLTALTEMDLGFCRNLTGSIPTSIGMLSRMYRFNVHSANKLTGQIPTEFGLLGDSLTELYLGRNDFVGTIPTEFGSLTQLKDMILDNCGVTSTIPTEIGHVRILRRLHLGGNDLTGTLPTEIGLLTNLTTLWLNNNHLLSGAIPMELASLTLLQALYLETTQLSGSIPESICAIAAEVVVDCQDIECSCCVCCCDG